MDKEKNSKKTIITAGAAAAGCGMVLYALGQFLSYLFRDVDPDRIEKEEEQAEEVKNEEDEGTEY